MTRRSSGIVAVVALALGVIALGNPAAAAQTPTVTARPAAVVDRQTITIRTSGFPSAVWYEISLCRVAADDPASGDDVCRPLRVGEGIPPSRLSTAVFQRFRSSRTTVDCAVDPGGCVVGVVATTPDGGTVEAWAPLTFTTTLSAAPVRGLADGDVVAVAADLPVRRSWTVAQCDLEGLLTPSGAGTDAMCGPAVPLTRDGRDLMARLTVHDPLVAVDGTETTCRYESCGLVVRGAADGSPRTSTYLSFGGPVLSTGWTSFFEPGEVIAVTLFGLPGDSAIVRQCAGTPSESTCDDGVETAIDQWGWGEAPRPVHDTFAASDGTEADCGTADCLLVAEVDGEVAAQWPIDVRFPASVALTPASGLLEGQPMTLTATGLPPSEGFTAYRCPDTTPHGCEGMGIAWSDAAGALTLEGTAAQRVGERAHCGVGCAIVLMGNHVVGSATYTMAEGAVTATPSTGLADGGELRVSGSNLLPTYQGPAYGPFPTGDWHVSQCEVDQREEPDLPSIFEHCAPPVPVTVTGSTVDVDLVVHTRMTTILGGTVDCTRPDACGVAVFRLESNAVSTLWAAPISFDT